MLVLDAGNALFKSPVAGEDSRARERAELLLEQMDALGTTAMAVGARDLSLGTDFLVKRTKDAKLKLLSANLVDAGGKPLFPASTVVTVGGVEFGLVGVSPEGPVAGRKGLVGKPPVPAALAEARRLREKEKVDVVVVLAAVPYLEAVRLSKEAGEAVDFIVPSHEGRGPGVPQRNGSAATLLPPGERGKQLARLELSLEGAGPFVDLTEAERARQELRNLERNSEQARERLAATQDASARKALEEVLARFQARREELKARAAGEGKEAPKRTLRFSYIQLGPDVADDPALKKRVERIEPPGSMFH